MSKLICVSIAHHTEAQGASFKGFTEHNESRVWSHLIVERLRNAGQEVRLALTGRLPEKVDFINKINADVALEIHFNGSTDEKVRGSETLYCPRSAKGKKLAKSVHSAYHRTMHTKDRGVKEGWYRMDRPNRKDFWGDVNGDEMPDYFLRATKCPAIILEPEFISQIKTISENRFDACEAICLGLLKYLEESNG